jgi:predicted lipoprotein with Yx(FWY)xxD motif
VKRNLILLAATIAVAALTGSAGASSSAQKIGLQSTSFGKILVDKAGDTLYMFTHDKKNKDTCVKISMCSGTWPALTTKGKPKVGDGVKAKLLGTITLAHGVKQVTYAGHPLYRYAVSPKDPSYAGTPEFGGTWNALNAAGKGVHP